jgi:hypothetical protein
MRATPAEFPTLMTANPNDARVTDFLRRAAPDLMVARCKWLLKRSVYTSLTRGRRGTALAQQFAWSGKKLLKQLGGEAWLQLRRKLFDLSARMWRRRVRPYLSISS